MQLNLKATGLLSREEEYDRNFKMSCANGNTTQRDNSSKYWGRKVGLYLFSTLSGKIRKAKSSLKTERKSSDRCGFVLNSGVLALRWDRIVQRPNHPWLAPNRCGEKTAVGYHAVGGTNAALSHMPGPQKRFGSF